MHRHLRLFAAATALVMPLTAFAAEGFVRDIAFPVEGPVNFSDDFSDPRSGGRQHEGNDLIGKKMMPLLSAVDGRVRSVQDPEPSWGYAITLEDSEGYTYHYLHVNNDTPGTDDGRGGTANAYAPGIERGALVTRGQHIGWMGDSGNAENVGAHLHFEMRIGGTAINPYESLLAASRQGTFDPAEAMRLSFDIDADKELSRAATSNCTAGTRIKLATSKAVYYCGADGKRYVFPNDKVYYSWYPDFSGVTTVTPEVMASLQLGGNVTYRPGVRMVKITTDPKVYAVDRKGTLRWVMTSEIASAMYGTAWAKKVDDLSDAFFIDYRVGEPITRAE